MGVLSKIRPSIKVLLVLGILVILSLSLYISRIPKVPGTVVKFINASLCKNSSLHGSEVSSLFSTDDEIYICGSFEIADELDLQQSVLVWIYKEGDKYITDYEYFGVVDIQEGYQQVPINKYLEPGLYRVEVRYGRRMLFQETMVIKSNE